MSFLMKVVVLGDEGVGKRTLINKLIFLRHPKKKLTIDLHWAISGFTTALYERKIGLHMIKFQIWILNPLLSKIRRKVLSYGTSGTKKIGEVYCYGALGAIVLFDITKRQSFTNVQRWIKLVWENNGRGLIPLTIVASKIDLREDTIDSISSKKGKELAGKFTKHSLTEGFKINYRESSIYDKKMDVGEIFQELGQSYIDFITLKQKG
ncbi:MAG: hypothetical protein ACFFAU_01840 [Candidatus Hodarchaeota archaeon]